MAEALFRQLVADRDDIEVQSAGVSAGRGQPASMDSVRALKTLGIDLSRFRSQPVTEELLHPPSPFVSSHSNAAASSKRCRVDLFILNIIFY